jgi:hypothetical protein
MGKRYVSIRGRDDGKVFEGVESMRGKGKYDREGEYESEGE